MKKYNVVGNDLIDGVLSSVMSDSVDRYIKKLLMKAELDCGIVNIHLLDKTKKILVYPTISGLDFHYNKERKTVTHIGYINTKGKYITKTVKAFLKAIQ